MHPIGIEEARQQVEHIATDFEDVNEIIQPGAESINEPSREVVAVEQIEFEVGGRFPKERCFDGDVGTSNVQCVSGHLGHSLPGWNIRACDLKEC